jgi:dsRNA-specific ribonuclease
MVIAGEGKSKKKNKAKEEAASQMLKQLFTRQNANDLPVQILPFDDDR